MSVRRDSSDLAAIALRAQPGAVAAAAVAASEGAGEPQAAVVVAEQEVALRPAAAGDAAQIAELINRYAQSNLLLPRSEENVRTQIGNFLVAARGSEVLGAVALHVYTPELAELRSLAVREDAQGLGLGGRLAEACMARARELGIARLFALTYQIAFFLRRGFTPVSKQTLPEKVWTDCIHCPRYYDCTEVAMALILRPGRSAPGTAQGG